MGSSYSSFQAWKTEGRFPNAVGAHQMKKEGPEWRRRRRRNDVKKCWVSRAVLAVKMMRAFLALSLFIKTRARAELSERNIRGPVLDETKSAR